MSRPDEMSELRSLRAQVAELTRALAERDQPVPADLLRTIVEGTASNTGEEFFQSLVRHLAQTLKVRYALVGEWRQESPATIRTLALWSGAALAEQFEYSLQNTPCDNVLNQRLCLYESGVQRLFPEDQYLVQMDVDSYCGMPLFDRSGKPLGVLVVMDDRPMTNAAIVKDLLQIFGARAAAELQRQQDEATLREHEAGLVAAQDLAHLGSWEWDIQTGTEQWSAEQYRIFGYAPNSIKATYDLFKQALYPEDRERVLAAVEAAFNERAPYDLECRIVHLSGELRFLQCQGNVIRDATGQPVKMRGTVLDITERKRMERELRLTQFSIDRGAEHAFWIDRDARILYVNDAACQRLGYAREELLAMTIPDLDPDYQISRWTEHWDELREHKRLRFETRHRAKSGDIYPVEVVANHIEFEGQEYNFAFSHDITDRKEAEQRLGVYATKLEQVNQSLDIALHQAKVATQAKSDFLATMSHEIRTPMNGVIGMTGLLLDTDLTPEQRDYAETVRSSGEYLLTIINDILDFSKIEAGKLALEIIDFDLRTTVDETLDLVAKPAADKGVNLACLVHANVPSALRGDPGRLRQILLNLLSNAIKFTAQGEVVLSLSLAQGGDVAATVRFEVQDSGIGLSPAAQGGLFHSFTQADNSTTRKYGGTGLGLAICKQLTELMGGQIGVESQVGTGSTFWFTVSLATQPPDTRPVEPPPSQDLRGRELCIVGDHVTNRCILEAYAAKWGLRCRLAEDGSGALASLRAAAAEGAACALAIIDMQMPWMDVLELARAIKADPALAPTKLILLTAQGQKGDAKAAQTAGYAGYLTKPIQEARLYECFLAILAEPVADAPAPLITRHSLAEHKTQGTTKLLLAEDNVINQKVAIRMLEKLGYRVDVAANGKEALDALGRIDYAAVLMDCLMPEMDGFAATAEIRRREASSVSEALSVKREAEDEIRKTCDALDVKCETPLVRDAQEPCATPSLHASLFTHDAPPRHIPIVAMTANAQPEDRARCLDAGMDDYISKPVQSKALAEVLARWVRPVTPEMGEAGSRVKAGTIGRRNQG